MSAIEPHLWVNDFRRAVDWYQHVLGFEPVAWFPDEGSATWCQMRKGEASIMLAVTPDPAGLAPNQSYLAAVADRATGPGAPLSLYLHVDDADALHKKAIEAGAEVIEEIWDAWWGGRQFTVVDPEGAWWTVFESSEVASGG